MQKKSTQPVFLDDFQMKILEDHAKKIIEHRNSSRVAVKAEISIDLLDTDKIKTVLSAPIIKQYDPNYRVNMRRNGIDAVSGKFNCENKNSSMKNPTRPLKHGPNKGKLKNASWAFHAFHNDNYNCMILSIWDKESLDLVQIYDIRQTKNIQKIKEYLHAEAEIFSKKVKQVGKKATNDRVDLPEQFIAQFSNLSTSVVERVTVIKDW